MYLRAAGALAGLDESKCHKSGGQKEGEELVVAGHSRFFRQRHSSIFEVQWSEDIVLLCYSYSTKAE
jgi:hypothetical protein